MRFILNERLPHRFVLIVGTLFGVSVVFLTPPFSAPDELAHLLRAYHCSQGKIYAVKQEGHTGDVLPSSFGELYGAVTHFAAKESQFEINWLRIDTAAEIRLDPKRQEFLAFANTALYTPVPYAPQALAMFVGRQFEMRPLYLIYAGRLANLATFLLMATAAVRIAPVQKWTLVLIALMPMTIYLAAVLSADAVTIGLAMLVFASTMNLATRAGPALIATAKHADQFEITMSLATRDGPTPTRQLVWLGVMLVLLGLSKQAYLGLVLLPLAIPTAVFGSLRRRVLALALLIGVPVIVTAAWSLSLRNLYVRQLPFVDPAAQSQWIMYNPLQYAKIMFHEMRDRGHYLRMIGFFGWLGPHLWLGTRNAYWVALIATAALDGGRRVAIDLPKRLIVFGTYVISAALMETIVYLSWEPIGLNCIEGLQPRYLLPLIPLLLLPIRSWKQLAASRYARVAVPIVVAIAVAIGIAGTWWILYKRYYLPELALHFELSRF